MRPTERERKRTPLPLCGERISTTTTISCISNNFKERKERIDQARKNAAQAEEVLARNRVDVRALKAIQDAERGFLTANAQLETGAPSVLLRGLAECHVIH